LAPNPKLFIGGAESGDVIQGQLGDCWFLGALAVVATRIDLIKEICVSDHSEHSGFVQFRFYKNGKWTVVTIDDRIPCIGNTAQIWGSSCKDKNEMWVPLIEKAYAKLHGTYQRLSGGWTADGFVDLTGGISERLEFHEDKSINLWSIMNNCMKEQWLMGCSAAGGTEQDSGMGILTGHAYSILQARVYEGEKLVQIRNPWGQKEWQGKWSDKSGEWSAAARKELKHVSADDGTFWMCFDDFSKHYGRMFICRLYNDAIGHQYSRYILRGNWHGTEAGGCFNNPTWKNNPQYGVDVPKSTNVVISLIQDDNRVASCGHPMYPIAFCVFKTKDNANRLQVASRTDMVALAPKQYTPYREALYEFPTLEAGKYIIVPSTFKPQQESRFWITILSHAPIKVHYINLSGALEGASHENLFSDVAATKTTVFIEQ